MNIKRNSLLLLFAILVLACSQDRYKQGRVIYENFCANCHMEAGQGLKGLYPPLANADFPIDHYTEIPCYIRNGMNYPIVVNGKTYENEMQPIKELGPVEIANVMNFMNFTWEMKQEYISPDQVKTALLKCK